jgi:hypothetical protein
VATAVREFDRAAPGRRCLQRLGREARFRYWLYTRLGLRLSDASIFWLVIAAVLILFFALGFFVGWVAHPGPGGTPLSPRRRGGKFSTCRSPNRRQLTVLT